MTSGRRLLNDWTTFADYTDDDPSTCQNLSVAIYQAQMDASAAETTLWNTILLGMADGLQWINGAWNWSGVSQLTKALYQVALADVSAKRLALNILVIQFSANNCWQWQSSGWYDGGEPVGQVSFGGLTCHQEYVYLEEYVPGFGWQTLWEGWANVCE